ncbi:TPA: DUF551 domain-containing protein [Citrobacter amalonaticus]|nr:DUF551 domain-containing protein [Citrobacter amalonaticus]
MTTTRFTKEQLIADIAHAEEKAASLCGQCADDHARLAYWLRIALASLEAEPVLYAAEETLEYAKTGELHLTCLSEPMGDAVIPLYAAPPSPVVPDAISTRQAIAKMENHEPCDSANVAYKFGWNACRAAMLDNCATVESRNHAGCSPKNGLKCAAMLQGSQPVSNRDELPVIGWLRSDYNSDDKRDPNTPLFMLGRNDPSETWGVKYIPLTGNSPVIPDCWVACSERMPETEGHYLVWIAASKLDGYCDHQAMAAYHGGKWSNEFNWLVTHWMPLPAAPQQEAE